MTTRLLLSVKQRTKLITARKSTHFRLKQNTEIVCQLLESARIIFRLRHAQQDRVLQTCFNESVHTVFDPPRERHGNKRLFFHSWEIKLNTLLSNVFGTKSIG